MRLEPGFYVDRVGRGRVSLAGYDSIGFRDVARAEVIFRRIQMHRPTTIAQLQAVTGLNRWCLVKLLREAER